MKTAVLPPAPKELKLLICSGFRDETETVLEKLSELSGNRHLKAAHHNAELHKAKATKTHIDLIWEKILPRGELMSHLLSDRFSHFTSASLISNHLFFLLSSLIWFLSLATLSVTVSTSL